NKTRWDAQVGRQVREYRARYPDKAVLCSLDRANGWSVLGAGGSIPDLPGLKDRGLLEALPRMRPFEPASGLAEGQWALAEPGRRYLVYAASGGNARLDLSAEQGAFEARRLDPRTNRFAEAAEEVRGGGMAEIAAPGPGPWVLWLSRK